MAKASTTGTQNSAFGGMKAQAAGTVKFTQGEVVAINASGSVCKLQPGDKVFPDDIIQTSEDGAVQIEFQNGVTSDLGRLASLLIDGDIFSPTEAKAETDDVARIQELIAQGADPTQVAKSSAAGGIAEDHGHGFTVVNHNGESGVNAGFDTNGIGKSTTFDTVVSGTQGTPGVTTGFNTSAITGDGGNTSDGGTVQGATANAAAIAAIAHDAQVSADAAAKAAADARADANSAAQSLAADGTGAHAADILNQYNAANDAATAAEGKAAYALAAATAAAQATTTDAAQAFADAAKAASQAASDFASTAHAAAGVAAVEQNADHFQEAANVGIIVTDPGTHGTPTDDLKTNVNTVQVTATDGTTTPTVHVTVDSTPVTPAPNGTVTLTDGTHTVAVTASDTAGNSKTVETTVTVDTTTPTVGITVTDPGTNHTSTTDSITNDNTVQVTATDGTTTPTVQVTVDSTPVTPAPNGTVTLADGTHTVAVTATDAAGNTATTSTTVTVDTVAPVVTVAVDDTGKSSHDGITSDGTITVATSDATATTVTVTDGTTVLPVVDGSITLAEGPHTISVTATDAAGNSTITDPVTIVVDTTTAKPTINVAGLTNDATPTLSGTAEAGATVMVKEGSTVVATATANSDGIWTADASTLTDGTHNLTAIATDVAGNVSDTTKASVTVATSSGNSGEHEENDSDDDHQSAQGNSGEHNDNGRGSHGETGEHDGNVYGEDHQSSQRNSDERSHTDNIDNTPPAAPTILLANDTGASNADGITNVAKLTGTAEAGTTVTVTATHGNETVVVGTAIADNNNHWTLPDPHLTNGNNLPDGQYNFSATATDNAGNVSHASDPLMVTLDTVAPVAPSNLFDAGVTLSHSDHGSETLALVSGKAEAGSTVDISASYGSDKATLTTVADSHGNFTASVTDQGNQTTIADILSHHDGINLTATATDLAGNTSSITSVTSNIIDSKGNSNLFASVDSTGDHATQSQSDGKLSISDVLGGTGAIIKFDIANSGDNAKVTLTVDTHASNSEPAHASFVVATSSGDVASILKQLLDIPTTDHHGGGKS